jgi:hypothetical protein
VSAATMSYLATKINGKWFQIVPFWLLEIVVRLE